MTAIRPRTASTALAFATAALLTVGCAKQDQRVFESTQFYPLSVALVDQTNKQTLWSYDIPVEHKLVVSLTGEGSSSQLSSADLSHPTTLNYKLEGEIDDSGTVELPGNQLLWVTQPRQGPETTQPGLVDTPEADEPLPTPELEDLDEPESFDSPDVPESDAGDAVDDAADAVEDAAGDAVDAVEDAG